MMILPRSLKSVTGLVDFRKTAFMYAFRIVLGAIIAWFTLEALHIEKKEWALISVAIVSEPDFGDLRKNTVSRIINTISGCLIGIFSIVVMGVNLYSLFAGVTVAVLLATMIRNYPSSWKLAPATVIAVMSPAIMQHFSWQEALPFAVLRTMEVLIGCVIAFSLGFVFSRLRQLIHW